MVFALFVLPVSAQEGLVDQALLRADLLLEQSWGYRPVERRPRERPPEQRPPQPAVAGVTGSCGTAALAGERDANQRQRRLGWYPGGHFLPVVMSVLAHVVTSHPPSELAMHYQGEKLACCSSGCASAAVRRRQHGAWAGTGTTFVLAVSCHATCDGRIGNTCVAR